MKQYGIVLADHWLESRIKVGLDHRGTPLGNSTKQNELRQSTVNPNLMMEILLVSIKDHDALLWTNMYLISDSGQITIYQDMQPPLHYNLQYLCFQESEEPVLPKDRFLLLVSPLRNRQQLVEQKDTQNQTRSPLCPYFSVLPSVTILPLLPMPLCTTVTDKNCNNCLAEKQNPQTYLYIEVITFNI